MRSHLIGAIALLALGVAPAMAADMPVKAMPAAPPVPTWTGFYIGVNGGGAWGSVDPNVRDIGPNSFFAFANIAAVTGKGSQFFHTSGGLAGGQVGYLYQVSRAIFGVEAAIDWTNLGGSVSNGPTVYPVTPPSTFSWNLRGNYDYLATFLGRVGFDMGMWYPYLTAGGAATHIKYSATYVDTFYPSTSINSFGNDAFGWALGGGAEVRFAEHWMLRGEYLHLDFDTVGGIGTIACSPGVGNCVGAGFSTKFQYNVKFRQDLARVALSYRF